MPDSQKLDELLTKGNTSADVFGDGAYRSSEIEQRLRPGGFKSRIFAAGRVRGLTDLAGGRIVRTVASCEPGQNCLQNLACKIRGVETLERITAA